MSHRITLQPAYLLHARPYRDTSLLVDLFTKDHGRITAVARGARAPRSRIKGLLQAFRPLLVDWFGKTELVTLGNVESASTPPLENTALFSGLYLNELLIRALKPHDAHSELYFAYAHTLLLLTDPTRSLENTLRLFEKSILKETGYGLYLDNIEEEQFYEFDPAQGFTRASSDSPLLFSGESLLALEKETLNTPQHLRDAKRLMRIALRPIIGHHPLKSRELFLKHYETFTN